MTDGTHDTRVADRPMRNRDVGERNAEPPTAEEWISSAVQATTIGELYDIARQAQQAGAWEQRDAAWCSAIRNALGLNDHAALALLRREFPHAELISTGGERA